MRFQRLEDMLCDELAMIQDEGKLTIETLKEVDLLSHALKCLKTASAMDYSGDEYSGRRYSRDENSRRSYRSERSYRNSGHEEPREMLERMLDETNDSKERQFIQRMLDRM